MNFDEINRIVESAAGDMSQAQKNSFEFTLTAAAELGERYEDTAYSIPFSYINFNLIASQFRREEHQAFAKRRTKKFEESDFPELMYGETEDQPCFSKVFADFMNVNYASVLHQFIEEMQEDEVIELTFDGNGFVYNLSEEAKGDEAYELVVEYANIFL